MYCTDYQNHAMARSTVYVIRFSNGDPIYTLRFGSSEYDHTRIYGVLVLWINSKFQIPNSSIRWCWLLAFLPKRKYDVDHVRTFTTVQCLAIGTNVKVTRDKKFQFVRYTTPGLP